MRRIDGTLRAITAIVVLALPWSAAVAAERNFGPEDLIAGRAPTRGSLAHFLTCAAYAAHNVGSAKADRRDEAYRENIRLRDYYAERTLEHASSYVVMANVLPGYDKAIRDLAQANVATLAQLCRR